MPPPEYKYNPRTSQKRAHLHYVAASGTRAQREEARVQLWELDLEEARAKAVVPIMSDRLYSLQRTCLALGEVEYGD